MQRGFILLTTTILLSLLMMILAVSLGGSALFTRFGTVDFYNKRASFSAARSCLETARLEMALDSAYAGSETVELQEGLVSCTIAAITTVGSNKLVKTRSQVKGATTNLRALLNPTTLYMLTLEETVGP